MTICLFCELKHFLFAFFLQWYRLPLGKELQPRTLQQQIQHLELLLREDDSADESAPVRPRVTLDWFGQLVRKKKEV